MRSSRRWQPGFSVCGSISPKAGSSVTSTGLPRRGGKAFQMHIPISELLNSSGGKGPGGPQTFKPIEGSVCSVVSHSATPLDCSPPGSAVLWDFSGKNTAAHRSWRNTSLWEPKEPQGGPTLSRLRVSHTCKTYLYLSAVRV